MDLYCKKQKQYHKYVRCCSDEINELAEKLKRSYQCSGAEIVSYGLNAISTLLHSLMIKNIGRKINLIYADEMYYDTSRVIIYMKNIYGYSVNQFSMLNHEKELMDMKLEKGSLNILLVESCSNPNGVILDYEILQKLKDRGTEDWITCIDNTWLTHCIQNPLNYKCVDYMVLSLTKYYSAGTCLCGCIITNSDTRNINEYIRCMGGACVSIECKNCVNTNGSNGSEDEKSSENTMKILKLIQGSAKDNMTINHPLINYDLSKKINYLKLFPPVFTINIKNVSKYQVVNVLSSSKIEYKTSFGDKNDSFPKREIDNSITLRLSMTVNWL